MAARPGFEAEAYKQRNTAQAVAPSGMRADKLAIAYQAALRLSEHHPRLTAAAR